MTANVALPSPVARSISMQPAAEQALRWLDYINDDDAPAYPEFSHASLPAPLLAKASPAKPSTGKDGLWRLLSATMAILNQNHAELARAKAKIEEQQYRIHNLEQISTSDELTGLKNRRGFTYAFEQELDRVNRGLSKGGTLVVIDMDGFKGINDTHGHLAGDACLRLVGQTLSHEVRTMDTAARLGGDEFILVFADADQEAVSGRIQAMASRLNHLSLVWQGVEIPIRASVGIKNYIKGANAEDVFNAADQALYEQKALRPR